MVKEGGDRNVCVFGPKLANQEAFVAAERFTYDLKSKTWAGVLSGWAIDIEQDRIVSDQNVITHPIDGTVGQKWDIEYCE